MDNKKEKILILLAGQSNMAGCGFAEPDDPILGKMQPNIVNCHLHNLPGDGCVNWARRIPMLKPDPLLKVIQSEVRSGVSNGKYAQN